MPGRTLPTFSKAEVELHNHAKDCYVTVGENVYDITDFVDSHPGGGELILEYGGKDVAGILKDEISHTHSESAYEILDESLVGFLSTDGSSTDLKRRNVSEAVSSNSELKGEERFVYASTGVANTEDLSKDTDFGEDYKKHKFLDLSKPLLMQVFFGGFTKKFYLEQVHRPRHYKGGDSAPLFGNFLEPLSKTAWWVIPMVWIPPVMYGVYLSSFGLSIPSVAAFFGFGLFLWTLVEYGLHRFLFHLDE